jgi:tetratricopeptide (TPR) repeat protein
MMIRRFTALLGLAVMVLATTSCQKLQARDNLNKGIKAFKETRFNDAVEHFKKAHELDPELTNAELYLATAYAQQFIPGATSDENRKFAEMAISTFEQVLDRDPKNVSAVAGIASMYQNLQDLQNAREWYKRQTELEPDNPVPYYAIGSLDWIIVRSATNPPPEEEKPVLVEEGLKYVDMALARNPEYEDAMTYKGLLLRVKAELTEDPDQAKLLVDEADSIYDQILELRRKNAEKAAAGG